MDNCKQFDYENGKITGLILAQSPPAGVPDRNVRFLCEKPLIAWSIEPMVHSQVFDRVYVATDSDEVSTVAKAYGAQIFRLQENKETLNKQSAINQVKRFLTQNPEIQMLCLVQCSVPCIHPKHIQGAVQLLRNKKFDSVFSVYRQKTFRWKIVPLGDSTSPQNFDPKYRPRRQDWNGELHENGAIYISKRDLIMEKSNFQEGRCMYYEMPEENSTEIETEFDFELAQTLIKKYGYEPLSQTTRKHVDASSVSGSSECEAYTGA